MSYRAGIVTGFVCCLLVFGVAGAAWWLVAPNARGTSKSPPPPPPAVVSKLLKEDQVNAITLTPEAVERLALRTAAVEHKPMPRTRVYGGEVMVPIGQTILVSAPLSGTLRELPGGMPAVGSTVKKGQAIFQLLPLLTPEGQANLAAAKIEADGQVKTAQSQLDAARIALDRAKRVFESEAGSRRSVDEAQAQFDLAHKTLDAVTSRRNVLEKAVGEIEKGTAAPLILEAPAEGLLRNVSARPGQYLPTGGALFEVADLRRLWVRVPVYVGDLSDVDVKADAAIGDLTMQPGQAQRSARPAIAPPSANAGAGTVDFYFDLDNRDERFRPGQRVGATMTLKSEAKSLTVPWSAVIHDIHGGTWVYEETGLREYVRRRVSVRRVVEETAVLAVGPAAGARVVVAGAAELFGTETGFTK